MQPYQVVETSPGVWQVKLYTTVVFAFKEENHAKSMADVMNLAFKSGYDVGYEQGFDSGRRSAI